MIDRRQAVRQIEERYMLTSSEIITFEAIVSGLVSHNVVIVSPLVERLAAVDYM